MKEKTVKIELTPEQQEQVRKLTGKDVREVTLNPEELEVCVPPKVVFNGRSCLGTRCTTRQLTLTT